MPHIKRERCQRTPPLKGFIMERHFPPIYRQLLNSLLVTWSALLQWARERFSKASPQLIVRGLALEQKGFCVLAVVCARTKVFLSFPRGRLFFSLSLSPFLSLMLSSGLEKLEEKSSIRQMESNPLHWKSLAAWMCTREQLIS